MQHPKYDQPKASPISRREALRSATGLLLGTQASFSSDAQTAPSDVRFALLIDVKKCYGCQACVVACKSENGVLLGNFRSWINQVNKGIYPSVYRQFLPRLCNHCLRPACVSVCPTGASHILADGVVAIDKNLCIGCRYCMSACPYGVRSFVWNRTEASGPAYPSRIHGVVDKCDLCYHLSSSGTAPACVSTCPAEARVWGNLNDASSSIRRLVDANPIQTLHPELGTQPMVFYLGLDQETARAALESGVRTEPSDSGMSWKGEER